MSRILVKGSYEGMAYVLRHAEGELNGQIYLTIQPRTVVRVGNSIGGYYAQPVKYAGQKMLSLIRVSGSGNREEGERGLVLKPGMTGLWATSSGSARRGVFHRFNAGEKDPIVLALREAQMPSSVCVETATIETEMFQGGSLCGHSTGGGYWYTISTDGKVEVVRYGDVVGEHSNQFHVGCQSSPSTAKVVGGSFALQAQKSQTMGGGIHQSICKVLVTPSANREQVAEEIRKLLK